MLFFFTSRQASTTRQTPAANTSHTAPAAYVPRRLPASPSIAPSYALYYLFSAACAAKSKMFTPLLFLQLPAAPAPRLAACTFLLFAACVPSYLHLPYFAAAMRTL